jgi:hypothetical protein
LPLPCAHTFVHVPAEARVLALVPPSGAQNVNAHPPAVDGVILIADMDDGVVSVGVPPSYGLPVFAPASSMPTADICELDVVNVQFTPSPDCTTREYMRPNAYVPASAEATAVRPVGGVTVAEPVEEHQKMRRLPTVGVEANTSGAVVLPESLPTPV